MFAIVFMYRTVHLLTESIYIVMYRYGVYGPIVMKFASDLDDS